MDRINDQVNHGPSIVNNQTNESTNTIRKVDSFTNSFTILNKNEDDCIFMKDTSINEETYLSIDNGSIDASSTTDTVLMNYNNQENKSVDSQQKPIAQLYNSIIEKKVIEISKNIAEPPKSVLVTVNTNETNKSQVLTNTEPVKKAYRNVAVKKTSAVLKPQSSVEIENSLRRQSQIENRFKDLDQDNIVNDSSDEYVYPGREDSDDSDYNDTKARPRHIPKKNRFARKRTVATVSSTDQTNQLLTKTTSTTTTSTTTATNKTELKTDNSTENNNSNYAITNGQNEPVTSTTAQPLKQTKNKLILCKPVCYSKSTECYPIVKDASTQIDLDEIKLRNTIVPLPLPINVPIPMCMYQAPMPIPILVPVPIPVPIFVPTTKKTFDRIQRKIKVFELFVFSKKT